ncbi:coiled-coil domain-containing protein 86 isoform X2 [Bacillus rossius redtenbacheri]
MEIVRYEDFVKDTAEPNKNVGSDVDEGEDENSDEDNKVKMNIVKGRRKSGKFWKDDRKKASSMVKTRGLKLSLEKKRKLREELKRAKEISRQLEQRRKQEKEDHRKRREENLRRREENQKKSELVQVIKNSAKIKRMKKKQLRRIEKRDTSNIQKK